METTFQRNGVLFGCAVCSLFCLINALVALIVYVDCLHWFFPWLSTLIDYMDCRHWWSTCMSTLIVCIAGLNCYLHWLSTLIDFFDCLHWWLSTLIVCIDDCLHRLSSLSAFVFYIITFTFIKGVDYLDLLVVPSCPGMIAFHSLCFKCVSLISVQCRDSLN